MRAVVQATHLRAVSRPRRDLSGAAATAPPAAARRPGHRRFSPTTTTPAAAPPSAPPDFMPAHPSPTPPPGTPTTLTIRRPDDWHVHFRDGPGLLASVVHHTARVFGRAVVMPNLVPPITAVPAAASYRARILAALPPECKDSFTPRMALYLTDETSPADVAAARDAGWVHGYKLYPAGATTNSASGVTSLAAIRPALAAMAEAGLPLMVHGEVTHAHVDVFDREASFLSEVAAPIISEFPNLKVVLEHITTAQAVEFVQNARPGVGATITPQHMLLSRNALFVGGLRPHAYCLPVLKRDTHRAAVLAAATSGDPRFFLGTDSAPHPRSAKESACGCAGIFSAPAALPLYAEAFEGAGALDKLEGFASLHGAAFYGLPPSEETVTLVREAWTVPADFEFGEGRVVPMGAGRPLAWRVEGV
jgi:dihydroorotase